MSFLNPGALWLLALLLPAILVMYFLKLRRQERVVASTLLWRRSVHDLRVNAPFQRLRKNLLLLLQLLIALLAVLALARPYTRLVQAQGRQTALILDVSASMATRDANGRTRLEAAKAEALALIEALPGGSWTGAPADQLCLIAAADRPILLSGLTADKTALREAVRAAELRSTTTDMAAALEMAIAVTGVGRTVRRMEQGGAIEEAARPPEGEEDYAGVLAPEVRTATDVILISDGAFPPIPSRIAERLSGPAGADETAGGSRFLRVGRSETPNLAIVSVGTRQVPGAGGGQLFVRLENTGAEERTVTVTATLAGRFLDEKEIRLPGSSPEQPDATGSRGVVFDLPSDAAGGVHVRIGSEDAFKVDDEVFAVIEPPVPIAVLLVTEGNFFLETALRVNAENLRYETRHPADWPEDGLPRQASGEPWEIVLFDRFRPPSVPEGASLLLDAVPDLPGISEREESPLHFPLVYDWKRLHPMLANVALLDRLAIRQCRNLAFEGAWAELIAAEGLWAEDPEALEAEEDWVELPSREVTLLGVLVTETRRVGVLAFDVLDTRDWVLRPGFPLFVKNAVHWLARPGGLQRAAAHRTGTTLRVDYPDPVANVTVRTPSGAEIRPPMAGPRAAYFSGTDEPGIYRVRAPGQPERLYAFSLLSSVESRIDARETVRLGDGALEAAEEAVPQNRELWPWLALLALGLLFLEWYVYNRRILA